MAGVNTDRHSDDDVSRLFARALDHALEFIKRSPAGSLMMNSVTHKHLGESTDGVELLDRAEQLHAFAWQAVKEEEVETPEGKGEDSGKSEDSGESEEADEPEADTTSDSEAAAAKPEQEEDGS